MPRTQSTAVTPSQHRLFFPPSKSSELTSQGSPKAQSRKWRGVSSAVVTAANRILRSSLISIDSAIPFLYLSIAFPPYYFRLLVYYFLFSHSLGFFDFFWIFMFSPEKESFPCVCSCRYSRLGALIGFSTRGIFSKLIYLRVFIFILFFSLSICMFICAFIYFIS